MYNETKWYDERATYRAITNGAYNFPMGVAGLVKGDGGVGSGSDFPIKGTIPVAMVRTGTISSNGVEVRGSDDADFSQIKPDDYLYDGNVVRRIKSVCDDPGNKLIELWQAFPSNVNGIAIQHCERQFFKAIYAHSTHDSDSAILQEAPFRPGSTFLNGGAPISYDATSGEISFTCHK